MLLFAFANDDRPGRQLHGLRREIEGIRRVLLPAEREGLCEIVVRESTTPDEIVEILEDPRYRRRLAGIHFAGHASRTQLLLEGAEQPMAARVHGLAPLLGQLDGLALLFLNGCATLGQAERFLDRGVPAVIATEHAVGDDGAQRFACDFYKALADGRMLSDAFEQAVAKAHCFAPVAVVARDVALAPEPDDRPLPWRLRLAEPRDDAGHWSLPQAAHDPLFGLPGPSGALLPQEPFMGLRRFTARESAVFFGRGRSIRNLYTDVTDPTMPPVLVVYGASGVGKSSLLEAGLLPRLEVTHEVHHLRLEREQAPEDALRRALDGAGSTDELAELWRTRERLVGRSVIVCIDQLEVLLLGRDGRRALARFARTLEALQRSAPRVQGKLLLGLRKEWFPELRNELQRRALAWHDHFVEPLGRDDIEEVVLGPTRTASLRARYGITCEPGVARGIADELASDRESAIAPVLQILLTRMWARTEPTSTTLDGRVRRAFTLETFDELRRDGLGLRDFVDRQLEALRDTHAEELRSGLALDLLVRHTTSQGTAATCRLASLRELYAHRLEAVEGLVERCSSLYLLQPIADATGTELGVRLAHDTLAPIVRELHRRSKAPGQAATRLLEARMGMSDASGRSRLLDEHDLAEVEAARTGMRQWTEDERRLVAESRRRRKATAWWRRLRQAIMVVSVIVMLVVLVHERLGTEAPIEVRTNRLSGNGASTPSSSEPGGGDESDASPAPERPLAMGSLPESLDSAGDRSSLETTPRATRAGEYRVPGCDRHLLTPGSSASVHDMAATADGARAAFGTRGRKKVHVFEALGSAAPVLTTVETDEVVKKIAWSPDGHRLAIGEGLGNVQLLHWKSGPSVPLGPCPGHSQAVDAVAFSARGTKLATAGGGEVIVRDGWSCEVLARESFEAEVHDLRSWSTSNWLIAGSNGHLGTWVMPDGKLPTFQLLSTAGDVIHGVEPLPRQRGVLAAGQRLQLWDALGTRARLDEPLSHVAHRVLVSENGSHVLTASSRDVTLWRWSTGTLSQVGKWSRKGIEDVAAVPSLEDVLIATKDGTVRWLMRMDDELVELRPLELSATALSTLVVDRELRYFAAGHHDGRVSLVKLPEDRDQTRRCVLNNVPQ